MDAAVPILEVRDLRKVFPGVIALDGATLAFHPGQIHAIVGENGAGKSTLNKILAGVYTPDAGQMLFRGQAIRWRGVPDAQRHGVVMIHQELNLVDELSVAANIFLGREPSLAGFVRTAQTHRDAQALLRRLGSSLDPAARVGDLSVAQKQLVEIAKALSFDASVLILDEPTAVLSQQDTAALFTVMRQLRDRGVALLYISHILPEVLALSDRVTVMRDGKVVRTIPGSQLRRPGSSDGAIGESELASLMVGRPLADHFPPRQPAGDHICFEVRHLQSPLLHDISIEVHRGEIFGLAGLVGAGRTELAETLFGVRRATSGEVRLEGEPLSIKSPADAIDHGLAYLSEDRKGLGLTLGMSVIENITLVSLRRYSKGLLSVGRERQAADAHIQRLRIKAGDPRGEIDRLSGGNQQKVALAKWLEITPRILIVDEPTRGVDIGAKEEIYRLLCELAAQGTCCIMISSELNELLGMCHRIGVMRTGQLVATLPAASATEQSLMRHAAGVH